MVSPRRTFPKRFANFGNEMKTDGPPREVLPDRGIGNERADIPPVGHTEPSLAGTALRVGLTTLILFCHAYVVGALLFTAYGVAHEVALAHSFTKVASAIVYLVFLVPIGAAVFSYPGMVCAFASAFFVVFFEGRRPLPITLASAAMAFAVFGWYQAHLAERFSVFGMAIPIDAAIAFGTATFLASREHARSLSAPGSDAPKWDT